MSTLFLHFFKFFDVIFLCYKIVYFCPFAQTIFTEVLYIIMKKHTSILLLCIVLLLSLSACGPNKKLKASMNMHSLSEKILDETDIDSAALVDDNAINKFLEGSGIKKDMLADHSINVPTEDEFEMLIILEARNDKDVPILKRGLTYIDSKYDDQKNTGSLIITKGRYVMLVNSEDNRDAQQIFDSSID